VTTNVTVLLSSYDAWERRWRTELDASSEEAERTCDYRRHDMRAADMREEAQEWADKAMEALRTVGGMAALSADHAHVLLDAINALRALIERGDQPWADYTGCEASPKATSDGYEALLEEAEAAVIAAITND
jgi:hypothetical protein